MKLKSRVIIGALVVSCASSIAFAQTAPVNPTDGRTGGAGPLGDNPSTGTGTPPSRPRALGTTPAERGAAAKGASPSDGRTGGAGPMGENPSTGTATAPGKIGGPGTPSADRRPDPKGTNSSDGRTGGAGPLGDNPSAGTSRPLGSPNRAPGT